ncbi:MAG: ATP-dependent DNA ligase, partial [Pseudomonadota bacterium]
MRLAQLVSVSAQVAATRKRLEKRQLLANLLRDAGTDRVGLVVSYLSGRLPQGRVGLGPALLRDLGLGGAVDASLTLDDVNCWVDEFAAIAGKGAKGRRRNLLER